MSKNLSLGLTDGLVWHTTQHAMDYLHALCKVCQYNTVRKILNEALHALCKACQASFRALRPALSSIPNLFYKSILTGMQPVSSEILHNQIVRLSHQDNIFHWVRQTNLCTATTAYHWNPDSPLLQTRNLCVLLLGLQYPPSTALSVSLK